MAHMRRCMKCGIDGTEFGARLKKCARCAKRDIEIPYCSDKCQVAHWQIHRLICCNKSPVVTGLDAKRLRAHISRWFGVYKPVVEWALNQLFLTRARDRDPNNPFLQMELEYAPGAPPSNVPRFRLTRLTHFPLATAVQIHLPDPFAMENTKMVRCILKDHQGYQIDHKCADNALAAFRDEPHCPRWSYVLADMVAFGFQDQMLLEEGLRLAIARHFTFEAFLGPNSPLRGKPFPPLSRLMSSNLKSSPWIWIEDVGFIDWFEREAGMTVAARLAGLRAQAHRDAYTEELIQWVDRLPSTPETSGV